MQSLSEHYLPRSEKTKFDTLLLGGNKKKRRQIKTRELKIYPYLNKARKKKKRLLPSSIDLRSLKVFSKKKKSLLHGKKKRGERGFLKNAARTSSRRAPQHAEGKKEGGSGASNLVPKI